MQKVLTYETARHGPNTKDLFFVVRWGSAVSFGALFATLQALRIDSQAFNLHFTFLTYVTFLGGTLATLFLWNFLLKEGVPKERKLLGVVWLLAVIGIVTFIYPLRFLPRDKLLDIAKGLSFAILVLSGVGCMMVKVAKALNADSKKSENPDPSEKQA